VPLAPTGPMLMLFSALPWMLAAGLLGPLPGAALGGISGLLIALYDGHSFFLPLLVALLAALFSVLVRQPYRTKFYRFFHHPLSAAVGLAFIFPLIFLLTTGLLINDSFTVQLDYAISLVPMTTLAFWGQLLIGAIFAQVGALTRQKEWGWEEELEASPAERSIQGRLIYVLAPFISLLVVALMAGELVVASRTANKMLRDRMEYTATSVSQQIPFALETGQNLITQVSSDKRFYTLTNQDELADLLINELQTVPFFHQMSILSSDGSSLAGYPIKEFQRLNPTADEELGIQLAKQGVSFQSYTLPPAKDDIAAGLTFITTVKDENGGVRAILLARSYLSANPFIQPVIESLSSMAEVDGDGILLDERGIILYHSSKDLVGIPYQGEINIAYDYVDTAPDGTTRMVTSAAVQGGLWRVITTIPVRISQQVAMAIAAPMLLTLLASGLIANIILLIGARVLEKSLKKLLKESGRIAEGDLDHPLELDGADEIGQLGQSFERMRKSLKARMEEINRLLFVSHGAASSLEMEKAVQPILEGALTMGASAARLVLASAALPEIESSTPKNFGIGDSAEAYAFLDNQILGLTEQQNEVVLTNPARARLKASNGSSLPVALIAVALKHEDIHYGSLWLAFDEAHKFSEEEKRFIGTLASQAALAASNARLYQNAQLGRNRLEAILQSTPDPVLVTDYNGHLLLANSAAVNLLNHGNPLDSGTPIEEFVFQEEILNLLNSQENEVESVEVGFPDNQIFQATASPVMADMQLMGRVCVLTDITQFKELDALKSDFVSTVSHDLRSPLTLMRGYATMLQMVGDLNEQQVGYIKKINLGVDSMSRLVNNLLDLGRIEAGVGLHLEMLPMVDIVNQVTESLALEAAQKQINLSTEFPKQPMLPIEADHALLYQLVYNLVENAIKYSNAEGEVKIILVIEDQKLILAVQDNGIGVAPVDQPRLFEQFYRAQGSQHRQQKGSGLGLAIVKSIAEKHGGSIEVESRLGQGSVFTLKIPLRQSETLEI
jgi:two-component system phosphate regulon sensor histidine kinase PhoR